MRGTADERSESLRFTETGDGNRNAGKLLLIEKQERHWKPVSSGAGYWVCQDLWELRAENRTGEVPGAKRAGNGRVEKITREGTACSI